MRFLFVYSQLSLGGVETLITRLANWLVDRDHTVTLCLVRKAELDSMLDHRVRVFYSGSYEKAVRPWGSQLAKDAADTPPDCVMVFDPQSFMMGLKWLRSMKTYPPIFHGIYHPRIYDYGTEGRLIRRVRRKIALRLLRPRSLVFMNASCLRNHENIFFMSLANAHILPVPMPAIKERGNLVSRRKIVSVGRLTPFKSYNLYMIDVVDSLVTKGYTDVEWHVYGYGVLESEMRTRIKQRGLEKKIFLHGKIDYSRFREAVEDAFVFVGLGTSLIEAGLIGVPGVVAVDSSGPKSYGYTFDLDGYDVGEAGSKAPDKDVAVLLESLIVSSDKEYARLQQLTRSHCKKFVIERVGNDFLTLVTNLERVKPTRSGDSALFVLHYIFVLWGSFSRALHGLLSTAIKNYAPSRASGFLRGINRIWLARNSTRELDCSHSSGTLKSKEKSEESVR